MAVTFPTTHLPLGRPNCIRGELSKSSAKDSCLAHVVENADIHLKPRIALIGFVILADSWRINDILSKPVAVVYPENIVITDLIPLNIIQKTLYFPTQFCNIEE